MKEEGDYYEWIYRGEKKKVEYPCHIRRVDFSGTWNGYVAIPDTHPCYSMCYDSIYEKYRIEVHGGLTYAGLALEYNLRDYWLLGFDTAHGLDFSPGIEFMYWNDDGTHDLGFWRHTEETTPLLADYHECIANPFGASYKTKEYVIEETNNLARQLEEIEIKEKASG